MIGVRHDHPKQGALMAHRLRRRALAGGRVLALLALLGLAAALLLAGSQPAWSVATSERAQLDAELLRAARDVAVPAPALAAIRRRERAAAGDFPALLLDGQRVAGAYHALARQARALEWSSIPALRQRVSAELQAVTLTLEQRQSEPIPGLEQYATALDGVAERTVSTSSLDDLLALWAGLRAEQGALDALAPAWQQMGALRLSLLALRLAGIPSAAGEAHYGDDVAAFATTTTAAGYAQLAALVTAQRAEVFAGELARLRADGPGVLRAFQDRIDTTRAAGIDVAAFQRAHDEDARLLVALSAPGDALALARRYDATLRAFVLPALRGQALGDLRALRAQVARGQAVGVRDPADGRLYPAAYEYAAEDIGRGGIGDAARALAVASSPAALQAADDAILTLSAYLSAMLANLGDRTPPSQPHHADLQLIARAGLTGGKVLMISLREQAARFYDHGKLVNWSLVTTGRPERPTPPGTHQALAKLSPTAFTSGEPPGSPLWVPTTTPIKYAIGFYPGGFYLHDGWWRAWFGPGSNLPHHEPAAFNGGSHGCINFSTAMMAWVYAWTAVGTPILVY